VVIESAMQNLAARVAAKIEEGDVWGAVRLTASNDTLSTHDDTVAALRQFHPPRTTPTCDLPHPPVDNVPALKLSENDVVAAISSYSWLAPLVDWLISDPSILRIVTQIISISSS
jgi:hypothetical protein